MIKPLTDKILVRELKPEEKSSGGIYIHSGVSRETAKAEVVSVSNGFLAPDGKIMPMEEFIKVGQTVLMYAGAGVSINVEGEELKVLVLTEVLGVVENA